MPSRESEPLDTLRLAALKDTGWSQQRLSHDHRILHSGQEVLGKGKCPERALNRHVALPLNKNKSGDRVRRFSTRFEKPLVPTLNLAKGTQRPGPLPLCTLTGSHPRGLRKTHLLRSGKAGRWTSRAGPGSSPSSQTGTKEQSPPRDQAGTAPHWRRRGAPPSRTPQLPPVEAASSKARRVTSRGRRAAGCHGDTWVSLPLQQSTHSDPGSGSSGTITKSSSESQRGWTSSAPTSFHAYGRLQRPLPVVPREPRPYLPAAFLCPADILDYDSQNAPRL